MGNNNKTGTCDTSDQEIQSIKAVLRGIGKLVNSSETNELKITFTTVRNDYYVLRYVLPIICSYIVCIDQ